jgi:AbrB family looped-hinge helix DNA binding protein
MSKVTSKLQITIPKAVAELYGIRPGDDLEWVPAGESVRLVPAGRTRAAASIEERLALFDQATERQRSRERESAADSPAPVSNTAQRGWTREDLYDRGRPD